MRAHSIDDGPSLSAGTIHKGAPVEVKIHPQEQLLNSHSTIAIEHPVAGVNRELAARIREKAEPVLEGHKELLDGSA